MAHAKWKLDVNFASYGNIDALKLFGAGWSFQGMGVGTVLPYSHTLFYPQFAVPVTLTQW